jgi:hypothetical protein
MPMIVNQFNANQVRPSTHVGLHAQLVEYDVFDNDGMNVGLNKKQTAEPGRSKDYIWYAGKVDIHAEEPIRTAVPIEYGAINLSASDPIKGSNKGLIGALVIEPPGSTWDPDGEPGTDLLLTRAAVTVTHPGGSFRDFVVIHQDDVNLRFADGTPVPTVSHEEEPEDSGMKGINYRTEPIWARVGGNATADPQITREWDYTAGPPRFRLGALPLQQRRRVLRHLRRLAVDRPDQRQHLLARPDGYYGTSDDSQWIDPTNDNTFWHGEQQGHGPSNHINMVPLNGCPSTGDFLYRDMVPVHVDNGEWAIVRCE